MAAPMPLTQSPGLLASRQPMGQFAGWLGSPMGQFASNTLTDLGAGLLQGNNWQEGLQAAVGQTQAMAPVRQNEQIRQDNIAKEQDQQNQTIRWLQDQGHEDLVQAVTSGGLGIGDAWKMGIERANTAVDPIVINGQLVDPKSRAVLGDYRDAATGPDAQDAFGNEARLWGDYRGAEEVKTYQAVRNSYERVQQGAGSNNGAGDIGVVFGYMKMLDPASTVREGEFATAESAGGAGAQIANLYNKLMEGDRLTPEQRQQFIEAAEKLYGEASGNLENLNSQFSTRAQGWNVNPGNIVMQPEAYAPSAEWTNIGGGASIRPLP